MDTVPPLIPCHKETTPTESPAGGLWLSFAPCTMALVQNFLDPGAPRYTRTFKRRDGLDIAAGLSRRVLYGLHWPSPV